MNKIIEVDKVTKCYETFKALSNISFSVWEGEILCFLGPNGAGKSTLIINIYTKLQVSNRVEAIKKALENGLIT
ncbi:MULTISPECIES: ATP-binding cassette domain-containing protein [Bacillus]|uniref:ATP-binding cassette domain-containing protein n=1 Tax=Bacillus TaxID=1386 RepID=UPI0003306051|nr:MULTISPECIES: ATP-binding cassette domain-containing protein [Bacillus cereus group]EOQ14195.1 hypothetical protein KOY_00510 [Bacillus cereus VDM021]OOG93177.1 hypothetical protein BTH41_04018 [Bacillus mycoides]PEK70380.1 hypothetical protein CN590_08575 [Bacillus pseudomycoides]PEL26046.1 hypothetical protein CN608_15040 [Bacillus pseudomycoides]PGE84239.1 hypothetical protein COM55_17835 [Bacillus pseudomycoides]